MNSLSILALAGLAVAVSLTADFPPPPVDEPTATLTLVKNGPGTGDVWGFSSEDCAVAGGGKFKAFTEWYRGETSYAVPAGKPIYLRARITTREVGMGRAQCMNISSFTPREGGRYEMMQEAYDGSCKIFVRDLDNRRRAPADLTALPLSKACKKAGYLF